VPMFAVAYMAENDGAQPLSNASAPRAKSLHLRQRVESLRENWVFESVDGGWPSAESLGSFQSSLRD
jgi:hypothetical protein